MKKITNPIGRIIIHLLMWMVVFTSTVPFLWTVLQSLKTKKQAHSRTPVFVFKPTLEHYAELWLDKVPDNIQVLGYGLLAIILLLVLIAIFAKYLPVSRALVNWFIVGAIALLLWAIPSIVETAEFFRYFMNTIIVGFWTVIVSVGFASLSAYALSRYTGLAGVILILMALAFRSLPKMAYAMPYFWMSQLTGLYDTKLLIVIALAAINQPFALYMLRSFFMDIPREIEEAAMIDGASRLAAFFRVIIPIMWPGIISTALFTLVLVFHEFLVLRILTFKNWTLSVAMQQYLGGISDSGSLPLKSAAAVSAALPLLIVVLIFQKQLVKGLAAGAVKG